MKFPKKTSFPPILSFPIYRITYKQNQSQFIILNKPKIINIQTHQIIQKIILASQSMFNNNNRPGGNLFGGNQQPANNVFGGNQQQQPGNMFNNQQQQTQQQGSIFGGQQQQQQQQGVNIFNTQNQQTQQKPNFFGGQQQQQGNNLFTSQQPQGGSNMFTNQQQQQPNIFGGQQQQTTNPMFPTQQPATFPGQQPQLPIPTITDPHSVRQYLNQLCKRLDPKYLQNIRLDPTNLYRDQRLGNLPDDIKRSIIVLMNNQRQLREAIDNIKKANDELESQAQKYCRQVQQKLVKYKEVLYQNIAQSNMINEVKQEVEEMQTQVEKVIKPLYNAYKQGRHFAFDVPDEFSKNLAKKILEKMIVLNNKVDEIISCQQTNDSLSEEDTNVVNVLEQLLEYYENVSAKVYEFSERYEGLKRQQLEQYRKGLPLEEILSRISDKVKDKMAKEFRGYDLIQEVESILAEREKREKAEEDKFRNDRGLYSRSQDRFVGLGRGY